MTPHDQISTPCGFAAFAEEWFDVFVHPDFAETAASQARRHKERWETAAGPVCWVKNRLLDAGYLRPGFVSPDAEHIVTATFHVGFVFIAETPEMVARLKNEPRCDGSPARSKFAEMLRRYAVAPIDATAARVSPGDEK
jgi:hypothetical protein